MKTASRKQCFRLLGFIAFLAIIGFTITGCPGTGRNNPTTVNFTELTADGVSGSVTTTQLTLTFSNVVSGLNANDITLTGVSGVSKGTLSGSGPVYTLQISGFTAAGELTVTVSKNGFVFSPSFREVNIHYFSGGMPSTLQGTVYITPNQAAVNQTLTANYDGPEPVAYQWIKDGVPISTGGNNTTYVPTQTGSYTVRASAEGFISKESSPVTVTPAVLPNVHITPTSPVTGDTLTANHDATSVDITYQWSKDGVIISGANNSTYQANEAGVYRVTISAVNFMSSTSDPVTVIVFVPSLAGNLSITGTTTINNQLNINYTGTESGVTYEWFRLGIGSVGTGLSYTPTVAGTYFVTASAPGYESKTSANVVVTNPELSSFINYPSITSTDGLFVNTTLNAVYTRAASESSLIISYTWFRLDTQVGTGSSFIPTEAGDYSVTITAPGYNSKSSSTVTIANASLPGAVLITGTAQVGNTLLANTQNLGGSGAISYLWQLNGTPISGATSASYTIQAADQGQFLSVTVTRANNSGSVTSAQVGPVQAPAAETGSVDGTVVISDGITSHTVPISESSFGLSPYSSINVTVSGSYDSYYWFVNNSLLNNVSSSLWLNGSDYEYGDHHRILVIVYRNGVPYSVEINFTVSN